MFCSLRKPRLLPPPFAALILGRLLPGCTVTRLLVDVRVRAPDFLQAARELRVKPQLGCLSSDLSAQRCRLVALATTAVQELQEVLHRFLGHAPVGQEKSIV